MTSVSQYSAIADWQTPDPVGNFYFTLADPNLSAANTIAVGWKANGSGVTDAPVTAVTKVTDQYGVTFTITIGGGQLFSHDTEYTFLPGTPTPTPGGVICFGAGTRLLTAEGYKAIETLTTADKIVTSDGRIVAAKGIWFEVPITTRASAPYRVEAHAFGRNKPAAPIVLSPNHKIQISPGLWTSPEDAAANGNNRVTQFGVGKSMRYCHLECENYLRDNLVAEGLVVESLSAPGAFKGVQVYTWNDRLKAYTRISEGTAMKQIRK
jgi:hypothetical protein